jgi:signal transduction histidine kinase/CheY-like chemotaxis protein
MWIQAWVDRPLEGSRPDEQLQARVVGWFIVLSVPVTALMLGVNLLRGAWLEALMGLGVSLVLLALMTWARARSTFHWLGHAVGAAQLALNLVIIFRSGETTNLAWLSVAPLAVLFFSGPRAALGWAAVSTVVFAGLVAWLRAGLAPEPQALLLRVAFSHWSLMPILLGIGLAFRQARDEAMQGLEHARVVAEAANRAKTAFLASMSHEIRTPLNGVLGTTELLLLRQERFDEATRDDLQTIHASGGMLLRLLNELLDLSRIEAGRLEVVEGDFPVGTASAEVIALFRAGARSKGITLEHHTTLPADLWLRGDSVRLRQVLNNLVGNALKFTDAPGRVQVRCGGERLPAGTWALKFDVEDTGRGIAPEHFRDVFEPYLQLHHTDAQAGSGLGLPLARSLARAMGGDVVVASESGSGSTFTLTVTLAEARSAARPAGVPVAPGTYSGRALVVDDNAINLRVAAAMVSCLGFEVSTASDGAAAVDALEHGAFDFVLMDRHMPVLDGLQATRRQRLFEAHNRLGHTPIIAVTASLLAEEVDACREAGMDDVLGKPLRLAELGRVLDRFALRRRAALGA